MPRTDEEKIKLDDIDRRILEILQKDGRVTKLKLAEAVHLSPSPTWERLRRLEKSGIISGYQARINPSALPSAVTVMVEITLTHHQHRDFRRFEDAVTDLPEVVECLATGGGVDYLMRVMAPDIDAYQRFMDHLLEMDIGIDRYFSYIVTKTVKEHSGLPLSRLLEGADISSAKPS